LVTQLYSRWPPASTLIINFEDDAYLARLVDDLLTHVEGCDRAEYWKDFLSMTDALMQNVHAVHIGNWDEYVSSLRAMLPWMVAYDNNRRWLPDLWSIHAIHVLLLSKLCSFILTLFNLSLVTPIPKCSGTCGWNEP